MKPAPPETRVGMPMTPPGLDFCAGAGGLGGQPHPGDRAGGPLPAAGPEAGPPRAALALGHTLLVVAYQVLKQGVTYPERDPAEREQRAAERLTRQRVRRLESLGHKVTVE